MVTVVTVVTMSKRFSIFCSSQVALPHQPVHVRMTILLISIRVKQLLVLLHCPILQTMGLFSMLVYRGTRSQTGCVLVLFQLEIIGINKN